MDDVEDDDFEDEDEDDSREFLGRTTQRSATTSTEPWYATRRRERSRRRRTRDEASARRCGGASLVASAALFVIGFSAIGRANYDEAWKAQVDAYEGVVREWTTRGRGAFQSVGEALEFSAPKEGTTSTTTTTTTTTTWVKSLTVTTRPERAYGTRGRDVSAYEPLWYELERSDLIEAIGIPELIASGVLDARDVATLDEIAHPEKYIGNERTYTGGYNNTAVMEALMGSRVLKVRVAGGQEIELASGVEFFTKTTVPITNWKTCKYRFSGYHHFGGCDTYSAIDTVCFKLVKSSNGSGDWVVDASYGGEGCAPRTVEDSSSGRFTWDPITHRRLVAPATGAYPALTVVRRALMATRTSGTSAVSLRHVEDPHIWLLNATDGTGSFAADAARLNATGIAMVVLACIFSIPAGCLLVPLAFESRAQGGASVFASRRPSDALAFHRRARARPLRAPAPSRDMV